MAALVVATRRALLIARQGSRWMVEEHLRDRSPVCLARDRHRPGRLYCGTSDAGVWRSDDDGASWEVVGTGIEHATITAVAVHPADRAGELYAGTEPSALYRSDDGGDSWIELTGLRTLPSAPTWSFPPRPETHHVRWIETDEAVAGRVFVAIEAGALVRTFDGGRSWSDRVDGGPYDTHTAATHRLAPGRICSAAGDGYFESVDAGDSWTTPEDGLKHRYLVGIAVDPGDPNTIVVSAAAGPYVAYRAPGAETYVYRKIGSRPWDLAMTGLPAPNGTTISRFATDDDQPGVIYAANNRGLFRSRDAGLTWTGEDVPWPQEGLADGVEALVYLPD